MRTLAVTVQGGSQDAGRGEGLGGSGSRPETSEETGTEEAEGTGTVGGVGELDKVRLRSVAPSYW